VEKSIVIVEDESLIALNLKDRLEQVGYTVPLIVDNAVDALLGVELYQPFLVLMDIQLRSNQDGIETADQIREKFHLPAMLVAALADRETMEQAPITEPFGYIVKPFNDVGFRARIEMALWKHQMERKLRDSGAWLAATIRNVADGLIATDGPCHTLPTHAETSEIALEPSRSSATTSSRSATKTGPTMKTRQSGPDRRSLTARRKIMKLLNFAPLLFLTGCGSARMQTIPSAPVPPVPTLSSTSIVLTPSSTSVLPGASDTLTGSVTPASATGTVTFFDSSVALGTSPLVAGQAALSTSSLSLGVNALTAVYDGTSALSASTSAAVMVTESNPVESPGAVTIDPSNPAILYSPYNWSVETGYARTVNSGAYFRTIFSGTSATLLTDTSPDAAPYSQFWTRIDNQGWTQYSLSAGNPKISVAINLQNRKHLLEVIVKSTSGNLSRWTNSQTIIQFTGLQLDPGAIVAAPLRRTHSVLIFGDSITEGVRTINNTATLDTDQNDVLGDYSYVLSTALDAEVGIVGFGGSGITDGGSGGVPPLPLAYNQVFNGVARDFNTYPPDLVIYNEGTNDNRAGVPAPAYLQGLIMVVQEIIELAPNSRHLILVPFDQAYSGDIPSFVQALGNSHINYSSTSGWFNPADSSDSLHPYNYEHVGFIAPKLIPVVIQNLY
jgi:DNA-binding response OmpR family regulator/lysophospholipase L1-like esterase